MKFLELKDLPKPSSAVDFSLHTITDLLLLIQLLVLL